MAKLVVSENVCLDGGVQDPLGEDGFDRGGWFRETSAADYEAWGKFEHQEALGADALLLGRRTDHFFARGWNTREGAWADRLRRLPKYVVSSTLSHPEWVGGTVLRGDVVEEVTRLKQRYERDLVVYGSNQLVRKLFEHDLVDEVRLTVHPFVLGGGERLLDGLGGRVSLRLIDVSTIGTALVHLVYQVVGLATPAPADPRDTLPAHSSASQEEAPASAASSTPRA